MSLQLSTVPLFSSLLATPLAPPAAKASAPAKPQAGTASKGHSAVSTFEAGKQTPAKFGSRVDSAAKGAYFRKVESKESKLNQGITGSGTLPQVSLDASRTFVGSGATAWQTGPLDRPSVYMGGRSNEKELDCGLSWDRVYDKDTEQPTYTSDPSGSDMRDASKRFVKLKDGTTPILKDGNGNVVARGQKEVDAKMKGLKENFAFRPFWRDTNKDTPKAERWHNPKVGSDSNVYFYPGERFTMSVKTVGKEEVSMDIQRVGGKPKDNFSLPSFRQEGFGPGEGASFKRVNSIDQFTVQGGARVGAETVGKVVATKSTVSGGSWDSVSLLQSKGKPVPMSGTSFREVRGGDTAKRYGDIFGISGHTQQGGERVDIHPAKR